MHIAFSSNVKAKLKGMKMIKTGQVYHIRYFMPTVLWVQMVKVKAQENGNYLAN